MRLFDADGRQFLKRWRLIDTSRFGLYLHHITGPDPGLDLHDHPWRFVSLILRGGYIEETAPARDASALARIADRYPPHDGLTRGVVRGRRAGTIQRTALHEAHRIVEVRPHTWTLIVAGRKVRAWGFFQPDGWVDFRRYDYQTRRPSMRGA